MSIHKIKQPPKPQPNKTSHEVARSYSAKGWGKYKSRSDWENSLRYQGTFTLPKVIT